MKKLDDLTVSPWPWKLTEQAGLVSKYGEVISGQYGPYNWRNASLMKSAPEMYEALREAVVEFCHECEDTKIENCRGKCFVARWREVLAKAAGESEAGK